MYSLNIFTSAYKEELLNWIKINNLSKKICIYEKNDYFYYIKLNYEDGHKYILQNLLEDIILSENQVIKKNYSVKEKIKKIVFSPCRNESINALEEFIKKHKYINLEGYMTFRMGEYDYLINIILYALIKNNLNLNNFT